MKKLNFLNVVILVCSFALMGCGKDGSSSKAVTTLPTNIIAIDSDQEVLDHIQNGNGTITTNLVSLHPDLAKMYSRLDLGLSLGTVIGNHTDLDANQGGDIILYKTDHSGKRTYSRFSSGGNTLEDVRENYWNYNNRGQKIWRGAFEGRTGTLVIVVDGVYQSGDGNDPFDHMSGSVWFKKWPVVSKGCVQKDGREDCKNPSGPLERCWDVSIGPYDCRFKVSHDAKTVTAVGNAYTSGDYHKVAEFHNLSRERTFKESY